MPKPQCIQYTIYNYHSQLLMTYSYFFLADISFQALPSPITFCQIPVFVINQCHGVGFFKMARNFPFSMYDLILADLAAVPDSLAPTVAILCPVFSKGNILVVCLNMGAKQTVGR